MGPTGMGGSRTVHGRPTIDVNGDQSRLPRSTADPGDPSVSSLRSAHDPRTSVFDNQRTGSRRPGKFGDVASVGNGISEMRVNFGPGYRVYFARDHEVLYVLLCGGDKSSQPRDIELAKKIWSELKGTGNDDRVK